METPGSQPRALPRATALQSGHCLSSVLFAHTWGENLVLGTAERRGYAEVPPPPNHFSPEESEAGTEWLEPQSVLTGAGPRVPRPGLPVWSPQAGLLPTSEFGHCQHLINVKWKHKFRMYVSLGWGR